MRISNSGERVLRSTAIETKSKVLGTYRLNKRTKRDDTSVSKHNITIVIISYIHLSISFSSALLVAR